MKIFLSHNSQTTLSHSVHQKEKENKSCVSDFTTGNRMSWTRWWLGGGRGGGEEWHLTRSSISQLASAGRRAHFWCVSDTNRSRWRAPTKSYFSQTHQGAGSSCDLCRDEHYELFVYFLFGLSCNFRFALSAQFWWDSRECAPSRKADIDHACQPVINARQFYFYLDSWREKKPSVSRWHPEQIWMLRPLFPPKAATTRRPQHRSHGQVSSRSSWFPHKYSPQLL